MSQFVYWSNLVWKVIIRHRQKTGVGVVVAASALVWYLEKHPPSRCLIKAFLGEHSIEVEHNSKLICSPCPGSFVLSLAPQRLLQDRLHEGLAWFYFVALSRSIFPLKLYHCRLCGNASHIPAVRIPMRVIPIQAIVWSILPMCCFNSKGSVCFL